MSEATTGAAGALTGTVLSDRYRLDAKLGSGGMSTVYLARDETLQRWVAAKVLHREISDQPDQIERFSREARAVAQVSHPNVVAVIDAGEDAGRPYIVFEFVEGQTLKERIESARAGCRSTRPRRTRSRSAAASPRRTRGCWSTATSSPRTSSSTREGRAKVTDFGIARELESDGLTQTGPRARHDRLRLSRAGDGPGGRRALRHLLARDPALRDAHRRAPVPGRDRWSGWR